MSTNKIITWLRQNWFTSLTILFLAILMISPSAKSWMLQQLLSTGIFNADIKKEGVSTSPPSTAFSYMNAQGIEVSTGSLKGKVVFINFWASWCPPCRAEMPSLTRLYSKLKGEDGIVFLFMNEDEDKVEAKQYLDTNHFDIPIYSDVGNVPAEMYNGSLPTTIILDKEGKIVLHHTGMAGYDSDKFIKALKELL